MGFDVLKILTCSLFVLMAGCTHTTMSQNENLKKIVTTEKYEIKISGEAGYQELQKYFYKVNQKNYVNQQLVQEHSETTHFTIQNTVDSFNSENGLLNISQKTIQKYGPTEMYSMAFPDLNETIKFTYGPYGDVLSAGRYIPFSIFYVSPIPLPTKPVQVGETWLYRTNWLDFIRGLEFQIKLVGTLKNVYQCYENEYCFEIQYEGLVGIEKGENVELNRALEPFNNRVRAKFIFRPRNYSIVSSEVLNDETLNSDKNIFVSKSCLVSRLTNTTSLQLDCNIPSN